MLFRSLDPIQIHEIRELIRELGQDHSVILSTHILPEVQSVCSRVLIIHEGNLVLDRTLERLHEDRHGQKMRLAFTRPPSAEALAAIPGVDAVETLDTNRYRITFVPGGDTLEALTQRAVNSCWGLCEMTPETGTLEETFMRLTSTGTYSAPEAGEGPA